MINKYFLFAVLGVSGGLVTGFRENRRWKLWRRLESSRDFRVWPLN